MKENPKFPWPMLLVLAGVVLISCSLFNPLNLAGEVDPAPTDQAKTTGEVRIQPFHTAAPQVTPPPVSWFEELPPQDMVDILQAGIDRGAWSEGEGLVLFLELFLGIRDGEEIPHLNEVVFGEGHSVLSRAVTYLEREPDSPQADEIGRLLEAVLPPEENLLLYSQPIDQGDQTSSLYQVASTSTLQGGQNCSELWAAGFPRYQDEDFDFYCFHVATGLVGDHEMRVFYPIEWSEGYRGLGQAAVEAMIESYQEFSKYGEMGDMTAIFVTWDAGSTAAMTVYDQTDREFEGCPFLIYPQTAYKGEEYVKHVVAHEAFHCFEEYHHGLDIDSFQVARWWAEGGAVYFSNVVYPEGPKKHVYLKYFEAHAHKYDWTEMAYENYVPFQFLANRHKNQWLVNLFSAFPLEGEKDGQLAVLYDQVTQQEYHEFGQAYLDETIADTGGGVMPIEAEVREEVAITGEMTEELDIEPFVLNPYRLAYDQGKYYDQTLTAVIDSKGLFSERLDSGGAWRKTREYVRTFCGDTDSVLLATSTGPDKDFQLKLSVETPEGSAWDMNASNGVLYAGDNGMVSDTGVGQLVTLSQGRVFEAEPLLNLTDGGLYIFEDADGTEYTGRGEYTYLEERDGILVGAFSGSFWRDPLGPVNGSPPDFTGIGTFEACPTGP